MACLVEAQAPGGQSGVAQPEDGYVFDGDQLIGAITIGHPHLVMDAFVDLTKG